MVKTKILTKQEKYSPKALNLKNPEEFRMHHPEETLLDEKSVGEAILECLKENDTESLIEILEGYLSALNKSKFSRDSKVPRRTLYHSLRKGNPTIKTLAKIVHAACH